MSDGVAPEPGGAGYKKKIKREQDNQSIATRNMYPAIPSIHIPVFV
jgi:hypothetical protein